MNSERSSKPAKTSDESPLAVPSTASGFMRMSSISKASSFRVPSSAGKRAHGAVTNGRRRIFRLTPRSSPTWSPTTQNSNASATRSNEAVIVFRSYESGVVTEVKPTQRNKMKPNQMTVIATLTLGAVLAFNSIAAAAAEAKPAAPVAENIVETVKPTAEDVAKLEAAVGLTEQQRTKVDALLNELKEKRRAIKEDANLTVDEKKAKGKTLNEEIQGKNGKIRALMTEEQFAKWQKLQEARRALRN